MKKLLIFLLLLSCTGVFAQDSLKFFNRRRDDIKITGMEVLGSWAVANIAISGISYYHSTGQSKYFHQMGAIFNLVNLGVAASGYIGTKNNMGETPNPAESLKQQRKIETIFLVNGGLDLVYIGSGFYLHHRGNNNNSDKLRGYGSSLIVQGTFLLLFDATMYTTEKNNGSRLKRFLLKNPVTFDGQKVGMVVNF
ncbi:hypothetical protein BH09BAC6_BH09BAC6_26190 [soil metagenome]|jgi:hypothetical protein